MATKTKMSARTKAERKATAKRIGAEVVAGLEQLLATLKAGGQKAVDEKYGIPPPPAIVLLKVPAVGKKEVKAARQSLGVTQPTFALIIGVSEREVRAWELGTKSPSGVACRLIGEIRHDPAYWRKRFGPAQAARE